MRWLLLALLATAAAATCYATTPTKPGEPNPSDYPPLHDQHRYCADLVSNPDAGHFTDAGTFEAPAHFERVPCSSP